MVKIDIDEIYDTNLKRKKTKKDNQILSNYFGFSGMSKIESSVSHSQQSKRLNKDFWETIGYDRLNKFGYKIVAFRRLGGNHGQSYYKIVKMSYKDDPEHLIQTLIHKPDVNIYLERLNENDERVAAYLNSHGENDPRNLGCFYVYKIQIDGTERYMSKMIGRIS